MLGVSNDLVVSTCVSFLSRNNMLVAFLSAEHFGLVGHLWALRGDGLAELRRRRFYVTLLSDQLWQLKFL